jgi:hypothetical protein
MGPFARELVARHPATPSDVLVALAGDENEQVQQTLAARPQKGHADARAQRRNGDARTATKELEG